MKRRKPFILLLPVFIYLLVWCFIPVQSFSQTETEIIESPNNFATITVTMGAKKFGSPFTFSINQPPLTNSWALSVSEFNGRSIFNDEGKEFPSDGYVWEPASDIDFYSSIYYVVAISFIGNDDKIIKTVSTRFFTPTEMNANTAPMIFFDGDTIDPSVNLYTDASIDNVIDLVKKQASTNFAESKILLRGHAAFISKTDIEREKEQRKLLDLSQKRALAIFDILIDAGFDPTHIRSTAFGGSMEISTEEEQRWKNRRVEIIFINENETSEQQDSLTSSVIEEPAESKEVEEYIIEPLTQEIPKPIVTKDVPPWPDMPILGKGQLKPEYLLEFVLYYTPTEDEAYISYLKRIILYYINESQRENVNHDVAFAQMLLETNYLRFNGQVRKEQYNFAGIGVVNDANQGNWFSTELLGVRAHIQHLKGYATTTPLRGAIVDPRYPILDKLGLLGSSPLVSNLSGRWATDPNYSRKILIIMRRMYNYTNALIEAKMEY